MHAGFKSLPLLISLLVLSPQVLPVFSVPAQAQTIEARKAEGDRLLLQGIQQYQTNQFESALQSWQQALILYREIKTRQGEGAALGNLGLAYHSLGNYAKAIEYQQQYLVIAREIKDRLGEGQCSGQSGKCLLLSGQLCQSH